MNKKQVADKLVRFLRKKYGGKDTTVREKYTVFQTLISCILSQRTREENTEKASSQLFAVAKTPQQILQLTDKQLERLIKPAGFYRQKAKKIKELCKILAEKYKWKVPNSKQKLMELPGVGPKTASVVMCYGFNVPCVPVDIHVEIASKRLGLVPESAKPIEVQKILEKLIPRRDQEIVNRGLVNFGRDVCKTRKPKCELCPFMKECIFRQSSASLPLLKPARK
jgi:endonuclease-3